MAEAKAGSSHPEKWQRDMAQKFEKNGYKIERSLLGIHDSWNELEADEGLFSLLAHDLAGDELDVVLVYDIMTSYENFRAIMGDQIYGIILLFECKEGSGDRAQRAYNKELQQRFFLDEDYVSRNMFFALQKAPNSCGTHALLSIILNIPGLPLTPMLQQFKNFTKEMPPEARGYAVSNHPELAAYHNRRAPPSLDIADTVKQNEQRGAESSRSGHHVVITQQNHFVPYVPIDGKLMELDGMKDHPINHGPVTEENWIEVCHEIIKDRIAKTTEQTRKTTRGKGINSDKFNVMVLAVRASHRSRCIRDLAAVQSRTAAIVQVITSSVHENPEVFPSDCGNLIEAFLNRPLVPNDPGKVPTQLPPDPGILSPVCEKILEILSTVQEKININLETQKKLVDAYNYRASMSPTKNGYSPVKQDSEMVNGHSSDYSPGRTKDIPLTQAVTNGCATPQFRRSDSQQDEIIPMNVLPRVAKRVAPNCPVVMPMEPDLSELPALFERQLGKIQTRSQRIVTMISPAAKAKPVIQRNVKITPGRGMKRTPSLLSVAEGPPRTRIKTEEVTIKTEVVRLPTPPPSVEIVGLVNGHHETPSPVRKIVNTITKVGGSLRSSTTVHLPATPQIPSLPNGFTVSFMPVEIVSTPPSERKPRKSREVSPSLEEPTENSSVRTRSSRSTSRRTPEIKRRDSGKNGYVSIVRNPLSEAQEQQTILERHLHILMIFQESVKELMQLEGRRAGLYKEICDENRTREEHTKNAVEREFEHSSYITVLLKRCFECQVFTTDELAAMFPALKISSSGKPP